LKNIVVIISAETEWKIICNEITPDSLEKSPYGEYFTDKSLLTKKARIIYFQAGWGKISSAASTQYIIDNFHPSLLINIGTCGGFKGFVKKEQLF
jgi:adenosylhomocysteine nucleosidase